MHNILHIFADNASARAHVSFTRSAAHALARAFVVLAAMMMTTFSSQAQTRSTVNIGTTFGTSKVFTITNANDSHHRVNVSSSSLVGTAGSQSINRNFLFAFVQGTGDDNTHYYLYNVGTDQFVFSDATTTTPYLGINNNKKTPVYVYTPGNSKFNGYPYVIAYDGEISNWAVTSRNNSYNHVMQVAETVTLQEWSTIGTGGNNSLAISPVDNVTFTDAEIAQAQSILNGTFVYSPSTFADQRDKITTNSKVYTFLAEDGTYLSANSSGLTTSTTNSSANEQWVFIEDETDNTKVYLYNVGQKKFVLVSGSSLSIGGGSSVGAVKVYTTDDSHGYNVAFGFGSDWATGPALSTNGVYTSDPSQSNRFQVAEVDGATFTDEDLKIARRRLVDLPTSYTSISYSDAGIAVNSQKYIIYTNTSDNRGGLIAQTAGLTTTHKTNSAVSTDDKAQQFVFVSATDDDQSVAYLYSVGQENFVAGTAVSQSPEPLTNVTANVHQIYVYPTDDYDYNRAFNFNSAGTWNYGSNNSGGITNLIINAGAGVLLGTYNRIDDNGSRFALDEAGSFSADELAAARQFLTGSYNAATFGTSTVQTGKVYTLLAEDGNYLSANSSGLTTSTTNSSDNEKFVFFEDPNESGKVYLYSVGQRRYISASKALTSGTSVPQIYVYTTSDAHGYTYAFNFSSTWNADDASAIGTTTTDISQSNRFLLTEVGDMSDGDKAMATMRLSELSTDYKYKDYVSAGLNPNTTKYILRTSNRGGLTISNSILTNDANVSESDVNDQFVFVSKDETATSSNVYLYSPTNEQFVRGGTANNNTEKELTNGLTTNGTTIPLPLYVSNTDQEAYPFAFSFSTSANWHTSSGSNNSGQGDLNLPTGQLVINSYSLFDDGNRLAAINVGTFSEADLAAARQFLSGSYNASTFAKQSGTITLSDKVYSLQDENGHYLTATANGLEASTTATASDAIAQFVFFQNPNAAAGTEEVYLYSVGLKEFVSVESNAAGDIAATDALHIFTTSDSHGYTLAFSTGTTWTSGIAVGTPSSTMPDRANRFKVVEASASTYSKDEATKVLSNSLFATAYSPTKFKADQSLSTPSAATSDATVYTLQLESGGYLSANSSGLTTSTTNTSVNEQFLFFQDPANETEDVYLYSVGQKKFAKWDATTHTFSWVDATARGNASRLYAFTTGDSHGYNLAFAFGSDTWTSATYALGSAANTDLLQSNRVKLAPVETTSLATSMVNTTGFAKVVFTGAYDLTNLHGAGLDSTKVYIIYNPGVTGGNQYVVCMNQSNDRLDRWGGTTLDYSGYLNNTAAHAAFVTIDDKVYLYSVSTSKAVKENGHLVTGSSNLVPVYIYKTYDPSAPVAFSFSSGTDWSASTTCLDVSIPQNASGNSVVNSAVTPTKSNRFILYPTTNDSYNLATARAALKGWMTTEFHYNGVHGRPFVHKKGTEDGVQYQDVAEYHYYYYVDTKRAEYNSTAGTITFKLPLYNYSGDGNAMEPFAYYRWYDYRTDRYNERIGKNGSRLSFKYEMNAGENLGYFATDVANPNFAKIGAYYTIPSEADESTWEGDIIACDVSRYCDYNDEETMTVGKFTHEPTLSIRYVYHILPAKQIADALRDSLCNTETQINHQGRNHAYYDQGVLVFGAKDVSARMNIRCNLQDIKQYYFHPVKTESLATKHVFYNDVSHKFDVNDFESEVVEAERIEWRVYNADKSHFRYIGSGNTLPTRFNSTNIFIKMGTGSIVSTSPYSLTGGHWQDLKTTGDQNLDDASIGFGKNCYLVGYVTNADGSKKCPFYSARLDLTNNSPLESDKLPTERTETYMSTNYGSTVANFQFDDENTQMTQREATSTWNDDNVSLVPSPFSWRQYSFIYANLGTYSQFNYTLQSYWDDTPESYRLGRIYAPLHGDFCLYKQYSGIAHDRTWAKTNGSQHGYFMYTDASDEARVLATQDFSGRLCVGSKIYISAWVSNGTDNKDDIGQPELRFNLLGVKKNDVGEDQYTKQLTSICSGLFTYNIEGFGGTGATPDLSTAELRKKGVWYQVYGVVTLPQASGVQGFSDFRIAIENVGTTTLGADYAIDDIEIYQNNAKLTVIQIPALCEGDNANAVDIKIKGNLTTLQNLADATSGDQTVWYRFVDAEGNAVSGTDFYGSYTDNGTTVHLNDYGIAVVPHGSSNTTELLATTYGNHSTLRFETGVDGQPEVVLVNKGFNLNKDQTYYVSLSITDPASATGASWGNPDDVCSAYSGDFQLVKQEIQIAGANGTTVSRQVTCGQDNSINYDPVVVSVTAPDKVNGGVTTLSGVHFFWFAGDNTAMNDIKSETADSKGNKHSLLTALKNYIHFYPGQAFSTSNEAGQQETQENDGQTEVVWEYTEADRDLIAANLYNATTNATGKLIDYSPSLSGYPIVMGLNNFLAIPADKSISVKINGQTVEYELCDDVEAFVIRGLQTGPGLTLGVPNVVYPASQTYRSIRIGLPQIRQMGTNGTLRIPIQHRLWHSNSGYVNTEGETLMFTDGVPHKDKDENGNDVTTYNKDLNLKILDSNDPSVTKGGQVTLATITNAGDDGKLVAAAEGATDYMEIQFANNVENFLHEGYWYEVSLQFVRTDLDDAAQGGNVCAGETFLTFKIVPEYLTWEPANVNGYNSNWNRDNNWRRSTAAELYNPTYKDYRETTVEVSGEQKKVGSYQFNLYSTNSAAQTRPASASATARNPLDDYHATLSGEAEPKTYVPMYFSKVTIPTLTTGVAPMMPYILKNQYGLILRMQNDKGERATTDIQYDMMATGLDKNGADSIYQCANFDGNVCRQILFKPNGQLRKQQFLRYDSAWVEIEVPVNAWSTFTTLMKQTPSGDLYLPKFSARQTTPSFQDITFDQTNDKWDTNADGTAKKSDTGTYGMFGSATGTDGGKTVSTRIYSRLRMPVYQRLWGQNSATEYPDEGNDYKAYDEPSVMLMNGKEDNASDLSDGETGNSTRNAWSHPFNAMVDNTNSLDNANQGLGTNPNGYGIAMKVGDDYATPSTKWKDQMVLMRLPKADKTFQFYKRDGNQEVVSKRGAVSVNRTDNYRLGIDYSSDENNLGTKSFLTPSTWPQVQTYDKDKEEWVNNKNGLHYVLVGNPYTSTILISEFIDANRSIMQTVSRDKKDVYCIWKLEGDKLTEWQYGTGTIAPGEAFFIKVEMPNRDYVTFTTRMQTDRNMATNAAQRVEAATPSRVYTVENPTDVKTIINSEAEPLLCTSPQTGYLRVQSGKALTRVMVYQANGILVANHKMADPYDDQFFVGSGIAIVRAIATDGTAQTAKIVVR